MKKYLAVILAAVMLLGGALAEGLTEYLNTAWHGGIGGSK